MHIWLYTQFFPPEMGAPAARFFDFGRHFVDHGHQMTVFTGFPNFPSGKVHEGYRSRCFMREVMDGMVVNRSWFYTRERAKAHAKGLGYATYAVSATATSLVYRGVPDVVLSTVPPPTTTIPARVASYRHRKPWVMDIRDLWPEALVAGGRLGAGPTTLALEALNQSSYRHASALVTVSYGKRARLVELGVPESKIAVIPNGVDLVSWEQAMQEHRERAKSLLHEHGISEPDKILLYAGIMNPPQGLDAVLNMARHLEHSGALDIYTVLVGDGQQRPVLEQFVVDNHLSRVRFLPQQPRETVAALYGLATAVLVPLRPRQDTHTVPSKVFEAMGSGKPILLSATGEVAEIVRTANAGMIVAPGDAHAMAHAALTLCRRPDIATSMGRSGKKCATERFDRRVLNARYQRLLEHVATGMVNVQDI